MSTIIDERVVEMRFDNKQFESNVATSMSTLDKLKQKLNLQGTSKGLEDLGAAAKKVDMSALGGAVENIKAKFSAMDVVAVTALANITNSAVNTGKQLIKSLSVDQLTSGWKKFSDKTTSVATLVAQGNAIEDVNRQLDLLNTFTDETSYNFTDMVSNIAKFTATGKGLDESVTAMEGIANWAALSGQNAGTASRAMYQLAQAMGAGKLRLEDYKSIQNASMDTEEFRQKCLDAGVALGTLQKNADDTYSSLLATGKGAESFNISQFTTKLTDGAWLTSEVMMKVFTDYAAAVNEICDTAEEKGLLVSEVIDEIYDTATEKGISTDEAIKSLGYNFDAFSLKAFEAAQKARTFNDAIDSVKDAVSTGWMNTFELIFGNAEGATKLWTEVANQLYDVFAAGGERRNNILDATMVSGWDKLTSRIKEAGIETDAFEAKVKELAKDSGVNVDDLIKKYGSLSKVFENGKMSTYFLKEALNQFSGEAGLTKEVIKGLSVDFNNFFEKGQARTLSWGSHNVEAVKKVQTALTELGFELPKSGINGIFKQETRNAVIEFQKSVGLKANGIVDQKTIDALQKAGESIKTTSEAAGTAKVEINDLIDSMNRPSGRDLIFDTISNSLSSVVGVLDFFRTAWSEAFSEDEVASGLYNALKAIRDFTDGVNSSITKALSDEKVIAKLANTFKGLGAVVDVVTSFVGGGFKLAFKSLSTILGAFNFDILGVTSNIGDLLVAFRDWVLGGDRVNKIVDWLVNQLSTGIDTLKEWGKSLTSGFKNNKIFAAMSKAVAKLGLSFSLLKEGKLNFVDFVKEIGIFCSNIIRAVPLFDNWINSFNGWLDTFKQTETFQKLSDAVTRLANAFNLLKEGKLSIYGFVNEFGTFISSIIDAVPILKQWKNTFTGWVDSFKNLPAVQQFVTAIQGMKDAFSKLLNGEIDFAEFGALLGESLGEVISSLPDIIKQASGGIISAATQIGSDFVEGFKNGIGAGISSTISSIVGFCANFVSAFASALGVHSPSVIAYSIGAFFVAGFIAGLTDNEGSAIGAIKQLGEGIATAFKSLISYLTDEAGDIQWDKIIAGGMTISTLVVLNKFANAFNKIANMVTSFSDILKSVKGVIDEFKNTIKAFQKTLKAVNLDILAGAAMKIAISVGILVASIWVLAQVDDVTKLWNAVGVVTVLCAVMAVLVFALSKFSEANVSISKDGVSLKGLQTILIQIGIAVVLLAATAKIIGKMDADQLKKGFIGLAGIAVGLVLFISKMGDIATAANTADLNGLGTMMLKISAALIVMVIAMKMISKMDPADIIVGIAVLEAFVLFCVQLGIASSIAGQNGQHFGNNVLKIAIAMGILAIVMKMMAKMKPSDIEKGIIVLQAFVILIGEMALVNRMAGGVSSKIGGTIMGMATSMMILAGTLWILSSMDETAIDNGIRVMRKFVVLIAVLTAVSQLGRGATNISANILAMSTAIGILAGVAIVLSLIPLEGLAKGIVAVSMLGTIMALMIWATRGANDVKGNLIAMTVAIGIMAAAIVALSFVKGSKLAGSVAALGTLMIIFGLMTKLVSKVESSRKMIGALAAMLGVVLALTGAIVILSRLDPKSAVPNAIALGLLLTTFAGSLAIMGHAGEISKTVSKQLGVLTAVVFGLSTILILMSAFNAKNAIPNAIALGVLLNLMATSFLIMGKTERISKTVTDQLGILTAVVGGLSVMLILMSALNVKNAIPNAIALGILLNLMAASLLIMGKAGRISKTVTDQLVPLTAVVAGLAIILGTLGALNIEASIPTAVALGILLNALASAMVILGFVGPNASKAVPAAMLMAAVVGEIAIVLGVLAAFNIQPSIETAVALSTLLLAVSKACAIMSLIPISGAVDGALGLAAFVGIIAGLVTGIGMLAQIGFVEDSIKKGAEVLGYIGKALGDFIGEFVGGVITGAGNAIIDLLPTLGEALADFSSSISGIDSSVASGAGYLSAAILALSGSSFIAGIMDLYSLGRGSLETIGSQLSKFGEGAKGFVDVVGDIDPSMVDSTKSLSAMILSLTASDFLSSLKEFIGGGSIDFENLGVQLKAFGTAVVGFSEITNGKINKSAIQSAKEAGDLIVELTNSLPRSGGLVQEFFGEKDLNRFATACRAFAKAIISINGWLSDSDMEIQSDKIEQLTKAGNQFAKLLNALPASEGTLPDFLGKQDLEKFGTACKEFADSMIQINEAVSQEGFDVNTDQLTKLTRAGHKFSGLLNSLPKSEGTLPKFLGKAELSTFGTACKAFADSMIQINESVSQEGFDVDLVQIEKLKQAGDRLNELQETLPKQGGWVQKVLGSTDIGNFGKSITAFATAMSDFSSEASGIDTGAMNSAIDAAERIRDLVATLDGINYSGVGDFTGIGFGAGHNGRGADGVLHDIGVAMSDFSTQVAEIKTANVATAADAAAQVGEVISAISNYDTSKISNFNPEDIIKAIDQISKINIPGDTTTQLTAFSEGIKAFNISEADLANINAVAPSMEVLSNAVTSWSDVKIPANLGNDLIELSTGISAFNTESTKTNVLADSAPGLEILGKALQSWGTTTVPTGLGKQLGELGEGVSSFSVDEGMVNVFTSTASGFGVMADSIAKWDGVTVPAGLGADLEELGTGIQKFSFDNSDSNIFASAASNMGILADSIAKWDGVTIPKDIIGSDGDLAELAAGIEKFTTSTSENNFLNSAAIGIGTLADSIARWDGVSIPKGLGSDIDGLATGIQKFSFEGTSTNTFADSASSIGILADSIAKWDDMKIPADMVGEDGKLAKLAAGIQKFSFDGSNENILADSASSIGVLAQSISMWDGVKVPTDLGTQLGTLATGIQSFIFDGSSDAAKVLTDIAPSIGTLATSAGEWQGLTIPSDISTSLTNLATGIKAFNVEGSATNILADSAAGVGELAGSVAKWADVVVPSDLGTDLSGLAAGIQAFTFDKNTSAAETLNSAAPAMGTMADSIKKWAKVTIPSSLGTDLGSLAVGIEKFNFDGESSLGAVAPAVGTMATSIAKWAKVTVPTDLGTKLSELATGVEGFVLHSGESSLSSVAPAIGVLATSVGKWSKITIKENLGTDLADLATGISGFVIRTGTNSLAEVAPAVGTLADSVAKWKDVTISQELLGEDSNLAQLAAGIKKFNLGDDSFAAVAPGVGAMADSIKQWDGVTISPELVGEDSNLAQLAAGIKKFTGGDDLAAAATNIGSLATAMTSWSDVTIPETIQTDLTNLAIGVSQFNGITADSGINALNDINAAATGLNAVSFNTISSGLDTLRASISSFAGVKSDVSGVGLAIVNNIVKPVETAKTKLSGAGSNAIKQFVSGIENNIGTVSTAGDKLITNLSTAISDGKDKVSTAVSTAVSGAASGVEDEYGGFYDAGVYLGQGLVEGINSMAQAAYDAGFALGQAAVQGEKDGQASASPSKLTIKAGKWLGEGLVIGMGKMTKSVYSSGKDMGQTAVNATRSAMTDVLTILNSDVDSQPTIRPVVDLTDVRSGANNIGKLLNTDSSIGVTANLNAVSSMMRNRQNGSSTEEVVSAIDKLRRDLGKTGNTTYTIGGITYDDGSNISAAVKDLVRAARVERRV